ncbi:MAG TPA: HAMP domain-containing protein [Desulfobulbaceae bacterium]|nr:HAMP domain-containing protein [Desulfobulbaceae bacterium]
MLWTNTGSKLSSIQEGVILRKRIVSTVCGRLTLSYTLLFGLLSLAAFVLVYVHIVGDLNQQTDDRLRATIREFTKTREDGGLSGLQEEFDRESTAAGKERSFFRLLDPKGRPVASSGQRVWQELQWLPARIPAGSEQFKRLRIHELEYPIRIIATRLEDGFLLQAGIIDDKDEVLESYRETFSTAFFLILVLGGIGAYMIARRAMSGVREVTEAAGRIAAGDLDQPISKGNRGEEIEALATMFNTMQKRVSGLIGELKAVINNVAHDLRMPITRMRGVAETTLTRNANRESYRNMAVTVIEESDRLVSQINTILELAEIDAGIRVLAMQKVDLAEIVRMAVELYLPAAEERDITLSVQIDDQPYTLSGNQDGLQRLLANLLDNAIKFTPDGGKIDITLTAEKDGVVLSVADNGPGIAKEDKEHIFDRFYRGDTSRSISGNGLGLALVKAIARKHNGSVVVHSDGKNGSCFVVKLPQ